MHRKIKKSFRFTKGASHSISRTPQRSCRAAHDAKHLPLCAAAIRRRRLSQCLPYIPCRQFPVPQDLPHIPYFSRSTLPLRTSTPSSRSRSACAPGPPNANSPDSSPFEFTTRKQGILSGSGFLWRAFPTARAIFLSPAISATCPYVATLPAGIFFTAS